MKLVEHADGLMQHAEVLYEKHQPIMQPDDRILAEDRMTSARDYRRGVENKSWLARAEQAKLYFERAQTALETVKGAVDTAIEIRGRKEGYY